MIPCVPVQWNFFPLGLRECRTVKSTKDRKKKHPPLLGTLLASMPFLWTLGKKFLWHPGQIYEVIQFSGYYSLTSSSWAVLHACLCNSKLHIFDEVFFITSNQVMLSFGAAPASGCGRGNSSALPDYLPEEDDNVVISDKVSKRHRKFITLTQSLSNLSFPLGNCKGRRKRQRKWLVFQCVQFLQQDIVLVKIKKKLIFQMFVHTQLDG